MPIKSNVGSFHISLWSPEQHFLFFSVPFFPFPILSDPACLPVPLGKSLPFLCHQLGRCFLSAPLDVGALVDPAWGLETVSRGLGMVRSRWRIASLEDVLLPPGEGEWELLVSVCFSWRGIDFALQILLFGACVGKAAPSRLKSKKHSSFFSVICLWNFPFVYFMRLFLHKQQSPMYRTLPCLCFMNSLGTLRAYKIHYLHMPQESPFSPCCSWIKQVNAFRSWAMSLWSRVSIQTLLQRVPQDRVSWDPASFTASSSSTPTFLSFC